MHYTSSAKLTVFPTGTMEEIIFPTYDNPNAFAFAGFGASMEAVELDDKLFISAGSPRYSGSLGPGGTCSVLYGKPDTQDYKQHGKLFGMPIDGYYDPAYCSYTPPGFYGESKVRIAYSSSIGGPTTLEDIMMNAEVTDSISLDQARCRKTPGSEEVSLTSLQDESKMPVASSISLFGKVYNPSMQFSVRSDGTATTPDRATTGNESPRWAISTKFESPVVDCSSSAYAENYTTFNSNISSSFADLDSGSIYSEPPRSIWTNKAAGIGENKYKFSIQEVVAKETAAEGSLIKLCGFTPGTKNVGQVAAVSYKHLTLPTIYSV